jgi:hypothetical protein
MAEVGTGGGPDDGFDLPISVAGRIARGGGVLRLSLQPDGPSSHQIAAATTRLRALQPCPPGVTAGLSVAARL